VFLIEGKEYPDPDASLPITVLARFSRCTATTSPVSSTMQTSSRRRVRDGTLEVTFRRRIGTKGRAAQPKAGLQRPNTSGELVLDVSRVASILASISEDRPLAWRLLEQAVGPNGELRLDYAPPASDLNLAEAQVSARTRLIDFAVAELVGLRPSL